MATKDPLDALAAGPPLNVLALLLWKGRHINPDMAVQITERDLERYQDFVNYLEVKPEVRIARPAGRPAQEATTGKGGRVFPGRPADPPKPYLVVALVEQGTENALRPVEDNQEDFDRAEELKAAKRAADRASLSATAILRAAQTGDFSEAEMREIAADLELMRKWIRQ